MNLRFTEVRRWVSASLGVFLLGSLLAACGGSAPTGPASAGSAAAPAATAGSSTGSGAKGGRPTVTVGYCCLAPDILPLIVAQQKFFDKEGVTVNVQRFQQGSATVAQALAANQLDLGNQIGGPDAVLRLGQKGAQIKMVATDETLDPVWLYAKKGIRSVADLKGKTVVVGGLGGPLYTYGVLLLMSGGLSTKDVKLIQNGNNQQRFGLLASGQADASTLSMPANFIAEQHGFHKLAYIGDVIKSADVAWIASDKALAQNQDGIRRFLKGIWDAENWVRQNPKEAAAIYQKFTKSDPQQASQSVQLSVPYYGHLTLDLQQLLYAFSFDEKVGVWKGPTPTAAELQKYMDDTLAKQIVAQG